MSETKTEDRVHKLSTELRGLKNKFLRQMGSKNPDLGKLKEHGKAYAAKATDLETAIASEVLALDRALEKIEAHEEKKKKLLASLREGIPETDDPVEE